MSTIKENKNRKKNLPKVLMTDKFRKFKSNNETMVVSSDNYLGVSTYHGSSNTIGDFMGR